MAWQAFTPYHPYPKAPLLDSSTYSRKTCPTTSYSVRSPYLSLTTEHLSNLSKHRQSVSSSGSSGCEPASPLGRRLSAAATDIVAFDSDSDVGALSSEEPWNLVTYHIPWGPGYEGYDSETGTLPGPDGICVFLRSPTPLKRQRTSQACDKCRDRKAKVRSSCSVSVQRNY